MASTISLPCPGASIILSMLMLKLGLGLGLGLLIILIKEVRDDKLDTLLSLDTTDELIFTCLVLWTLPWGEHIITFIGVFLLILEIISLRTFTFKTLSNGKEDTNTVTLTSLSSSHTTTSSLKGTIHSRNLNSNTNLFFL